MRFSIHGQANCSASANTWFNNLNGNPRIYIYDTERGTHPLVTLGILQSRELGLPRFVVDDDGAVVRLRFETRYHPGIYRHAAAGLVQQVETAVLRGDAALRSLLRRRRRRFVVEAAAPGSVTPPPDKYDP